MTSKSKAENLKLGPIVEDCETNRDLLPALLEALRSVDAPAAENFEQDTSFQQAFEWLEEGDDDNAEPEIVEETTSELIEILESYRPAYTRMGWDSSDENCYGVWIDDDMLDEGIYDKEVLVVDDLSEVPNSTDAFYVLHVNDHGNRTFYQIKKVKKKVQLEEIWAVV